MRHQGTTSSLHFGFHERAGHSRTSRGGHGLLVSVVGLLLILATVVPAFGQSEGTVPDPDSDHTTEEALLRASNAEERDGFGWAVDVDGNRAIIGARNEAGPSNRTPRGGAAYVFERANSDWNEAAILRAPDAGWGDRFGHTVAIDGDWAVVGAYLDDGPSDRAYNAGAAYLFHRSEQGTWSHVQTLRASEGAAGDRFGYAVAMDGDRVVVGAWLENGPSGTMRSAGAAYVFKRSGEKTWTEEQVLRASNADAQDGFGVTVAIDGEQALVGATGEAGPSNGQADAGAAYLFERTDAGTWTQVQLFRASNAEVGDLFGWSVAIEGTHAVIGVHREDGPNNEVRRAGAVYVFERTEGTWPDAETALIRSPNIETNDEFGYAVDIERERILVGAVSEDGPSVGPMNSGTAYLFETSAQGWTVTEDMPFRASNAGRGDLFGRSVALDGPWMMAGTLSEDGPSDSKGQSGAAYLFKRTPAPRVALNEASEGKGTDVFVDGTVRPGGAETAVSVEYRDVGAATFQRVAVEQSPVDGIGSTTVQERIEDVEPGTEYQVRLVAVNDVGGDTSTTATVGLPPVVTQFEGNSAQNGVQLRWTAAAKPSSEGFQVLRQVDGAGAWTEVGMVKNATRKSTSQKSHTYAYTDEHLPYAADSVSYRLKQMNTAGEAYMTKSVAVGVTAEMELLGTYPNPAREHATVRFSVPSGEQDDVRLRLYDVLGREVRTVVAGSVTGRHEKQVDVSGLASGTYVLQLEVGQRTQTQRMTVVR